jgi:hypothetical protein
MGGAIRLPIPLVKHRKGGISQQSSNYSYFIKKEKLLQSALDTLHESDQMLRDASILGYSVLLLNKIAVTKATAQYSLNMILAKNWKEQFNLFWHTKHIPLTKKFRFLHLNMFPSFHRFLLRIKQVFN